MPLAESTITSFYHSIRRNSHGAATVGLAAATFASPYVDAWPMRYVCGGWIILLIDDHFAIALFATTLFVAFVVIPELCFFWRALGEPPVLP
jgi:hypothetical protein